MTKRKDHEKTPEDKQTEASAEHPPKELEQLDSKELLDKLQRVTADFMNYQKRMTRNAEEVRLWTKADIIKSFLPIVDDLEQALEAGKNAKDIGSLLEGFKLVHQHMQEMLNRQQVEAIPTEQQSFDPAIHEAVMHRESPDHEPGTVVTELRKGYTLNGRTLRPARVAVSKTVEAPPEQPRQDSPADSPNQKQQDSQ